MQPGQGIEIWSYCSPETGDWISVWRVKTQQGECLCKETYGSKCQGTCIKTGEKDTVCGNLPDTECQQTCSHAGQSCTQDSDCCQNEGLYCYKGTCHPYCETNSDCDPGECCTAVDSPGPGESQGRCVGSGIYSGDSKWLCDPPAWRANREETGETSAFKLFEIIKTILRTTLGVTV